MKVTVHEQAGKKIAEVQAQGVIVRTSQEALDLLMSLSYAHGATKVILHAAHLAAEFFDLKTRIAGDVLQKVVNYRMQLAIVGDFTEVPSESLRAFIAECNRGSQIFFTETVDAAKQLLFFKDL